MRNVWELLVVSCVYLLFKKFLLFINGIGLNWYYSRIMNDIIEVVFVILISMKELFFDIFKFKWVIFFLLNFFWMLVGDIFWMMFTLFIMFIFIYV